MTRKRIVTMVLLLALLVVFGGGHLLPVFYQPAYAAEVSLTSTTVEEDLEHAGINLMLYQKNPAADPQVLMFSEFAYSESDRDIDDAFHLLFYIYNPSGEPINLKRKATVNISIGGTAYANRELVCYGYSTDHLFYRFYVAKDTEVLAAARACQATSGARSYSVSGVQYAVGSNDQLRDTSVGKTYTFSGYAKGCHESTEIISTLTSTYTGLESISLTLNHTTWRNKVYNPDNGGFSAEGVCDAISTAYFGVPEEYIFDYKGGLKQISAEWYQYKTTPIFVTWDSNSYLQHGAYGELKPWIGITMAHGPREYSVVPNSPYNILSGTFALSSDANYSDLINKVRDGTNIIPYGNTSFSSTRNSLTRRVLWNKTSRTVEGPGYGTETYVNYNCGFNPNAFVWSHDKTTYHWWGDSRSGIPVGYFSFPTEDENVTFGQYSGSKVVDRMDWLFGIKEPQTWEDAKITSEELELWMRWYSSNIETSKSICGKYSANLFEPGGGKVTKTISVDDVGSTLQDLELSTWEKLWYGGSGYAPINYAPLLVFDIEDIRLVKSLDPDSAADVKVFEDTYLVENDNTRAESGNVLRELQAMISRDEVPVLLRFAKTEYSVYNAYFDNTDPWYESSNGINYFDGNDDGNIADEHDGYVAQETVFLDFDVLSLGFDTGDSAKSLVIIPVVADPIDIISGLIAPNNAVTETDWWLIIFGLLLLIILLVVFWPFVSPVITLFFRVVFRGLVTIVRIIFRLLGIPIRLIGAAFSRNRR